MLHRLIKASILCSCLFSATYAHTENIDAENASETDTRPLAFVLPAAPIESAITQENTVAEELIAEISAFEAELDNFSALDALELPDVDTSWLMKLKMGGAVVWQDICEHPTKYIVGSAATIATIAIIVHLCKKKKATNPA